MTVKEITNKIKHILEELSYSSAVAYLTLNDKKWLKAAIKALEQEPCEDAISRQAVEDKLVKLCDSLEEIFANIRMKNQDESVCGLCEYDCPAPFECKGFETDECFKLAYERRHKWQSTKDLPSVNPQPKTGHWIPVSEELPEEGKEVLTCSNGGFIEIQSLEDSCADIYWENQKGDWTDLEEIIAWMPLPEPYKAESEEKAWQQ